MREHVQELAVKAGIFQAAEVMSESIFLEAQAQLIAKQSHLPRGKFKTLTDAEAWLDSLK